MGLRSWWEKQGNQQEQYNRAAKELREEWAAHGGDPDNDLMFEVLTDLLKRVKELEEKV